MSTKTYILYESEDFVMKILSDGNKHGLYAYTSTKHSMSRRIRYHELFRTKMGIEIYLSLIFNNKLFIRKLGRIVGKASADEIKNKALTIKL